MEMPSKNITKKCINAVKQKARMAGVNAPRDEPHARLVPEAETVEAFHRNAEIKQHALLFVHHQDLSHVSDLLRWLSSDPPMNIYESDMELVLLLEYTARALRRLFLAPKVREPLEKSGPAYYQIQDVDEDDESIAGCTYLNILDGPPQQSRLIHAQHASNMVIFRRQLTGGHYFMGVIAHEIAHEMNNKFWPQEVDAHGECFVGILKEIYRRLRVLGLEIEEAW